MILAAETRAAHLAMQEQYLRQVTPEARDAWWHNQWRALNRSKRQYAIEYWGIIDLHTRTLIRYLGPDTVIRIAVEEEL